MIRAFDVCANRPWLITEDYLQIIMEIAARENLTPEAVAAQRGKPLDHSHMVTMRGPVAVIPVEGPIVRYADLFTEISGATSIETLAQDLRSALTDSSVQAIVLAIDSPGGEVSGTHEFADMVYAARGQKRIVAYVSDMGASAAYWIASAASEVVVDATARIGSIGVVAAVPDPAKSSARHLTFVSSQSPNKRPDPTTEHGKGLLQDQIDALAQVFVESVARNRGVSPDAVLADFGQGGMFVGQAAVAAGLADRVGSFESVVAELSATPSGYPTPATVPRPLPGRAGATAHSSVPPGPESAPPRGKEKRIMAEENTQEDPRVSELQARIAEMEAREAQAQAQRDQATAAAVAAEATAHAATARVAALETEARRRDLAIVAKDFVNASVDEHVGFMEQLDPAALAFYTKTQRAAAEQQRQSELFGEKGRAGTAASGGAVEQAQALINARAKEAKISIKDATLQIAAEQPELVAAANRAATVRV